MVESGGMADVSVACLSIYDMLKYVGKDIVIGDVMLVERQ